MKKGAFPVVWKVFSDAVFENFDGLLRGQSGLMPTSNNERKYLALPEAATLIGISNAALKSAIDRGLMSAHASRQGVTSRIWMLSRAECEQARVLRAKWVSESQAAADLGVTDSVLQSLVCSGVLESDDQWRLSIFKGGPIPADALLPLAERVSSFLQTQQVSETLMFKQLNARRTVDIKALSALFKAIFNGGVRAIGGDNQPGLGGFILSTIDIKRYVGSAALQNGLTLTQLETATGWKYEPLSRWTELNLLESELVLLQGRSARIVTVSALSRFRREWLPISEIAASVSSKGSAITKRLTDRGVVICGQTNPKNGAPRGGLIRLSDLTAPAGLCPFDSAAPRLRTTAPTAA